MQIGLGLGLSRGRMIVGSGGATLPRLEFKYSPDLGTNYQENTRVTPSTVDGNAVGSLTDLSGLGRHMSQSGATARFTLKTNIQNGRPMLLADGVNDRMAQAQASYSKFLHDGTPSALILVCKTVSGNPGINQPLIANNNGSSGSVGFNLQAADNQALVVNDALEVQVTKGVAGQFCQHYLGNSTTITKLNGVGACASGKIHTIVRMYIPSDYEGEQVYVDGQYVGRTATANLPFSSADPASPLTLANRGDGSSTYANAYYGDIEGWSGIALSKSFILARAATIQASWNYPSTDLPVTNRRTILNGTEGPALFNNHMHPSVVKVTATGEWLMTISNGNSHNNTNQRIDQYRSTDEGVVWAFEKTLVDTLNQADSDGRLSEVDGVVYLAYSINNYGSAPTRRTYVIKTSDGGANWSAPVQIGPDILTDFCHVGSYIVKAQDTGNLLIAVYGRVNSSDTDYKTVLFESADAGATWAKKSIIAQTVAQFEETNLAYFNGKLFAIIRVDGDKTTRLAASTDHGATWGAPQYAFSSFGYPHTRVINGKMVVFGRHSDPLNDDTTLDPTAYAFLRWSDDGIVFRAEQPLSPGAGRFYIYAGTIIKNSTTLFAVWAEADPVNDHASAVLSAEFTVA